MNKHPVPNSILQERPIFGEMTGCENNLDLRIDRENFFLMTKLPSFSALSKKHLLMLKARLIFVSFSGLA